MKLILSSLITIFFVTSLPSASAANTSILGTWRTQAFIQGFELKQTMTIEKNRVSVRTTCSRNGYSGTLKNRYPVQIGSSSIDFLIGSEGRVHLGAYNCHIYQNPGPVQYRLHGDQLWLRANGVSRLYLRIN